GGAGVFGGAARGAARVGLFARAAAASLALERNRVALGASAIEIVRADALAWLAGNRTAWNLIFLDPPFGSGLAASLLPALGGHLAPAGLVYVEQGTEVAVPAGFIMLKCGRAGRSCFALLEKEDASC
ncbi:MAG: RsmD family RNA methyltransferase, partial [Thiobacillus sp.]